MFYFVSPISGIIYPVLNRADKMRMLRDVYGDATKWQFYIDLEQRLKDFERAFTGNNSKFNESKFKEYKNRVKYALGSLYFHESEYAQAEKLSKEYRETIKRNSNTYY